MADGKFRELFELLRNPGDDTIENAAPVPAGGKTVWIIGRGDTCDLIYQNPKISRMHCKIEYLDSHYYLTDLNSTNGTYLNGRLLERKERIFSGDIIGIGSEDIVFSPELLK